MCVALFVAAGCAERAAPIMQSAMAPAGSSSTQVGVGGASVTPPSPVLDSGAADAGAMPPSAMPTTTAPRAVPPPPPSPADDAGEDDAPGQTSADASAGSATDAGQAVVLDERDTLVPDPTWTCGVPDGIPGPLAGTRAFTIDFTVSQEREVGTTPFGKRRQLDISGGTIEGAKVSGQVLPGGLEYELTLDNGVLELEQIHVLTLGDALVFMRNCGVSPASSVPARVVLDIEAATGGPYAFLNTGRYIATRSYEPNMKRVRLEVYELTGIASTTNSVRVQKPTSRPSQSWKCKSSAGAQGAEVYRATVEVSTEWWTVGESKYGNRNIIPIQGGMMSGRLKGRVLPGGADYQIIVGNFELDARYTLQTDDGELIIVRNCGALGALVPTFETRSDGPYAWLHQGSFRSADPVPSLDLSEINLIIYQAR